MKNNRTNKDGRAAMARKNKARESKTRARRAAGRTIHPETGMTLREMEEMLRSHYRWCAYYRQDSGHRAIFLLAPGDDDTHLAALKTRLAEREKRWAAAKLEHPPIHIGLCRLQLLSPRGQENHAKIKQWLYREIGIGPNKEPGGA